MRGNTSKIGATRLAPNGYHYTKTADGWRLTHHIIAEEKYNRKVDKDVTVRFSDGDRTNFDPDNIVLTPKRGKGRKEILKRRIAEYKQRIAELEAELKELE